MADFQSHYGSAPISIVWKMKESLPGFVIIGLVTLALSGSDLFEPLSVVIISVVYSLWFDDRTLSSEENNLTC